MASSSNNESAPCFFFKSNLEGEITLFYFLGTTNWSAVQMSDIYFFFLLSSKDHNNLKIAIPYPDVYGT
jgi:hypothetical protein